MSTRALLLSIRPKYAELIFSGRKKVELRRTRPRIGKGDLALIYVSSPVKSLMGALLVTNVVELPPNKLWLKTNGRAAVNRAEYDEYFAGAKMGYAIEFSRCWQLAQPVSLTTLRARRRGFRPPQSFRYLSGADLGTFLVSGIGPSTSRRRASARSVSRKAPSHARGLRINSLPGGARSSPTGSIR